jgi:hypothetical protein
MFNGNFVSGPASRWISHLKTMKIRAKKARFILLPGVNRGQITRKKMLEIIHAVQKMTRVC